MRRYVGLAVLLVGLAAAAARGSAGEPLRSSPSGGGPAFEFALIGDLPYTLEDDEKFPNLLADLNAADLAFVVHDGDFKNDPRGSDASRSKECSDELYAEVRDLFDTVAHPLIYTPGDNEWTDCHLPPASADPLERLDALRRVFFAGDHSLGRRTLPLSRQSADPAHPPFRENARWTHGEVTFLTLHVVGSNNNLGRTAEGDAEYAARTDADLAWLRAGFAHARGSNSRAIMIVWQANPWDPRIPAGSIAYTELLQVLEEETVAFGKPVVLVHGDTHYFRIDKPLGPARGRVVENFTRVETFGTPNVHWVQVSVDYDDPNVFVFRQRIVPANVDPR